MAAFIGKRLPPNHLTPRADHGVARPADRSGSGHVLIGFLEANIIEEAGMVASRERTHGAFGPWHPAATLASALLALGLMMGWSVERTAAGVASPAVLASGERCRGGDDVSRFVCRNTWLAYVRSYR